MPKLFSQKGFSIKELIIVLFMITALIASSIPLFFYLRHHSQVGKLEETVKTVKAAIAAWHYDKVLQDSDTYPPLLDANPAPSVCLQCFDSVLPKGLSDTTWLKLSDTEYLFSTNQNFGILENYQESGDYKITYNPLTGSLSVKEIP